MVRMGYVNKLVRPALGFAGSESRMLCCAVLVGNQQSQEQFEVHTFLLEVYAHGELKRKAVLGYEKLDNKKRTVR